MSNAGNRRTQRRSIVLAVVFALTAFTYAAHAVDTITVNAASDLSDVSYITGFTHGYSNYLDCNQPAVMLLKPRDWRVSTEPVMQLAEDLGSRATFVLSDAYANWKGGYANARPWENWTEYEQYIAGLVNYVLANYSYSTIYWDVWNEPDLVNVFWFGTYDQLVETFARTINVVKGINPNLLVVGPSTAAYSPEPGGIATLLDDLDSRFGVRLDAVAWHENGPDPHELPAHTVPLRNDLHTLISTTYTPPFQINEYGSPPNHKKPGRQVCWLSYFDQEGITWASRACWDVYVGTPPSHTVYSECWCSLNGMFMQDNTTKQHNYWVYKAYADQLGRRLTVTSSNVRVRGIASKNAAAQEVRILLGRYLNADSVTINLLDFPYSAPNGVRVVTERIPNENENYDGLAKAKPLAAPLAVSTTTVPLVNGDATISISSFAEGDAYTLVVTPAPLQTLYQPTAVATGVGTYVSGNLASVLTDNNNYYVVGSHLSPAAYCTFQIAQPKAQVTQLRAKIRSKDSRSSGNTRRLYLYNYDTLTNDIVTTNSVTTSESDIQITVNSNASRYVSATGQVVVSCEHYRTSLTHTVSVELMEVGINGG